MKVFRVVTAFFFIVLLFCALLLMSALFFFSFPSAGIWIAESISG